ncbi:hypothetical protein H2203_001721 [Taxawa tesnikishii (nom. ined.)]|nr:hypothetical protein H2203_001721 [Dothideales sp. JES 119]
MHVPFLRTPEECFADLPDFPYVPRYLYHGNLRMAYIDESSGSEPAATETFLCLHGQPTWSYLYRKMIPVFLNYTATQGKATPSRRVIAPDLFGFGRSDKPTSEGHYTFHFHRNALLHLVREMDLQNITLVVQDWGGILGLTLPLEEPSRFKRLVVMNTTIATGLKPSQGFLDWRDYSNRSPDMAIGRLIGRGAKHLSEAELQAYDIPFPGAEYKAGVRRFPNLVMIDESMEGADISRKAAELFKTQDLFGPKDIFMACGMRDPVLGPSVMRNLARVWKNGCYFAEIEGLGILCRNGVSKWRG